jgi:16S rRNA C1402 N4-methylase RsmH
LADFGFCSYHLDTPRGFSWLEEQQLDMRYAQEGRTAADIVDLS